MPNFTEALSKPVDTIEKPKPKPAGPYRSVVQGLPKVKEITAQGEKKEVLSFTVKPLMALEGVDQDDLKALPDVQSWPPQSIDFWEGEQGEYQAVQFLTQTLGIDPGPKGKSKTIGQMCAEANGKQLVTVYGNYPYQDKTGEMQIGTRIVSHSAV